MGAQRVVIVLLRLLNGKVCAGQRGLHRTGIDIVHGLSLFYDIALLKRGVQNFAGDKGNNGIFRIGFYHGAAGHGGGNILSCGGHFIKVGAVCVFLLAALNEQNQSDHKNQQKQPGQNLMPFHKLQNRGKYGDGPFFYGAPKGR